VSGRAYEWTRDVFHPFGNLAAATDTNRARPLALRPGLTTGLPFRGCEAARLQNDAIRRETPHSGRLSSELLSLHFETYVTIPVSQIVRLREFEVSSFKFEMANEK